MTKSIKSFNVCCLLFTVLLLSACTAAEYFIKRAVNGFQDDIVKELKSYADFSPEQSLAIESLAAATDQWMRDERLTIVESLILTMANDVEQQGQIQSANWNKVANFLSLGLANSQSPDLINRYTQLTVNLSEEQVSQVLQSFDDALVESLEESEDRTIEKQNERIVDGLKWVFRAIDQPLTRAQREYASDFLGARIVDFEYQRQLQIKETKQLSDIVANAKSLGQEGVYAELLSLFKQVENTKSVPSQEDWQHNVDLFLQLINHFLSDLDQQERVDVAIELRDYARIFNDLSKQQDTK